MRLTLVQMLSLVASAACSPITDVRIGADVHESEVSRDAGAPEEPQSITGVADAALPTTVCGDGQADCDGEAANGCEADLRHDPKHCGACGSACRSPDCACQDGILITRCSSGHADCDGDALTGCETDLATDMRNCGACQRRCHADGFRAASATCEQGKCTVTCQIPTFWGNCDGNIENGCEAGLWEDSNNCGMCGRRCQTCNDGLCL